MSALSRTAKPPGNLARMTRTLRRLNRYSEAAMHEALAYADSRPRLGMFLYRRARWVWRITQKKAPTRL